jgi:hypothetical protein
MKNATPRMRLAFILVLMLPVAAFGQQADKALNPEGNVQNDRGIAKQHKGDLDGAMADFNQAIKLGVLSTFRELGSNPTNVIHPHDGILWKS